MARERETAQDDTSCIEASPPVPGLVLVYSRSLIAPRLVARGELDVVLGHVPQVAAGRVDPPASIDDDKISAQHAAIARTGGSWRIRDLGSRNGTYVMGQRIERDLECRGDVVVRCGSTIAVLLEDARGHERAPLDDEAAVVGPELAATLAEVASHAGAPSLAIQGESGSGKELAARRFHDAGPRAKGPLVAINCAAIPEGVAERVLFGAKKGAYSGATADTAGCLQDADGGTLFLDEIAELDPAVQAKLLRALETRIVTPLGASKGVPVDLGVVVASHRDLRAAVAARTFREDLYFRLSHPAVRMPALRERRADIPRLVARFVAPLEPHARLVEACCLRAWPGNVRELRNALVQAAAAARAAGRSQVRVEDLPDAGHDLARPPSIAPAPQVVEQPRTNPRELSREAVAAALDVAGGNISAAARALGLHRTQLRRLIEKYGIAARADDEP